MKAPFERLRSSGDDGIRTLWVDLGGEEGEMVRFDVFSLLFFFSKLIESAYTKMWSLFAGVRLGIMP